MDIPEGLFQQIDQAITADGKSGMYLAGLGAKTLADFADSVTTPPGKRIMCVWVVLRDENETDAEDDKFSGRA